MRDANLKPPQLRDRAAEFWDDVEQVAALSNDAFAAVTPYAGIYGLGAARAELVARASSFVTRESVLRKLWPRVALLLEEVTDPKSHLFVGWPEPGRNPTLEAADIAIAAIALQGTGLPLHCTLRWLTQAAQASHIYHNNWQFAPILAQLALASSEYPSDKMLLRSRLLRLDRNRIGRVYLDEVNKERGTYCLDLYPFWAWSYYTDAVEAKGYELGAREADAELVRLLDLLVLADGRLIRFGRSSAYDGAALVPARLQCRRGDHELARRARDVYGRYWWAARTKWLEERWLDRLTRLSACHCSRWRYGTSYSVLWALRSFDLTLIDETRDVVAPEAARGLLVSVPSVASGAKSRSSAVVAFAAQSPGRYSHVHSQSYSRLVIAEADSGDHLLRTELALATGVAGRSIGGARPSLTILREIRQKGSSGLLALMPTPRSIWVAADRGAAQKGLIAWRGSKSSDEDELDGAIIRQPGVSGAYVARLSINSKDVSVLSETRDLRRDTAVAASLARSSQEKRLAYFDNLYRQASDPWSHAVFRRGLGNFVLADVMLQIAHRASIIDIGCGSGDLTALLSDVGFDAFGVDCSGRALAHARRRWPIQASRFVNRISVCRPESEDVVLVLRDVDYYNDRTFVENIWREASGIGQPFMVLIARSGRASSSHPPPCGPRGVRLYELEQRFHELLALCEVSVWVWVST